MSIKQIFLISALSTFSAQAMEEIKVAEDNPNTRSAELAKLDKYVPNKYKFIFSILGKKNPGKNKHLPKILQQGLPDDIIKQIILYLKVDTFNCPSTEYGWVMYPSFHPNNTLMMNDIQKIAEKHLISLSSFYTVNGFRFNILEDKLYTYIDTDISEIRILPILNKSKIIGLHFGYEENELSKYNKILSWIKNHKLQTATAVSIAVGVLGYVTKKLRK